MIGGTPAHPEHPSGHAYISSAAATALTFLYGPYYPFTDHSYDHLGWGPRSYRSFADAASEAADSRVYWGIHYQQTCELSVDLGKTVGTHVNKLRFRDFSE